MWETLTIVLLLGITGYGCFQLGRRVERGRQEIRAEAAREASAARGRVRLNRIVIRR